VWLEEAPLRIALFCILLVWFRPPILAQQPAESPLEKCTIDGQVLDAATGDPVKKAEVLLRKVNSQESPYGAMTDARGHFAIEDVEPGDYRLWVERNGYIRSEYGARRPNHPGTILALGRGQRLRDIILHIVPQSAITGRVFDEDGEAISNVQIQALQYSYVRGKRQLVPSESGLTNDLGEYRIHGLTPGGYVISAMFRSTEIRSGASRTGDDRRGESAPEEGYAPTYYPGTSDPAAAIPVEVAAGNQIRGIDLTLLRIPTARVRGRVWNGITNRPGRNAMVMLLPRESARLGFFNRNATSVQDPDGNFEIHGVVPGSYVLFAQWGDGSARQPLEVWGTTIDGANLTIASNMELPGRVRIDGKGEGNFGDMRIYLEHRDLSLGLSADRVKPDGTFTLHNVAPDAPYTVNLIAMPENLYTKSIRLGFEDVLETGFTLSRGTTASRLEVLLSPSGGESEGVVLDDRQRPFSGATVVLVPEPRRRSQLYLYKTTTTDQYGRFRLRGIAPGEYKIFAWEDIESGAYQDPEFIRPFESRGQSFSFREYTRQTAQLALIPAEESPLPNKKEKSSGN